MNREEPYAWVDDSGRALRRSRQMLKLLVVWDLALVLFYVWAILQGGTWWWNTAITLWVLAWLAAAIRSHLRFAATHDQALLAQERYRMGLPPEPGP